MEVNTRDIEIYIDDAKKAIARCDALKRLEKSKDFRTLITDGYLRDFAIANVQLRRDPNMRMNEKLTESNLQKIEAISELYEYFRNIRANGAAMQINLEEAEKELEAEKMASEE